MLGDLSNMRGVWLRRMLPSQVITLLCNLCHKLQTRTRLRVALAQMARLVIQGKEDLCQVHGQVQSEGNKQEMGERMFSELDRQRQKQPFFPCTHCIVRL